MQKRVIAEKPSVAKAIAEVLPGGLVTSRNKRNFPQWYRCGDWYVTWAVGHILEQFMPQDYDQRYAKWALESLPIIPPVWKVKPKKACGRDWPSSRN